MITRLIWLAFAIVCIGVALRTPIATDITLFLPDDRISLMRDLREGPAARLILIAIEGDAQQAAQASKDLAAQLRQSGLFVRVVNGAAGFSDALHEQVYPYRYLLSPHIGADSFSTGGLRSALEQRLRALASPLGVIEKRFLADDPSGAYLDLLRLWQRIGQQQPEQRFGVWFAPRQSDKTQSGRALLLLESKAAGFDLDAQAHIAATITSAFESINADISAAANAEQNSKFALRLLKSGPALFALASRDTIRQETQWLSMLASGLLVVLLLLVYRSLRLLLLGALPLLFAIFSAWALLGLLFGSIHGITLAFGITLLGVAIDYPIHFFSHLNQRESHAQSLQRIWPTLRLSAFTTALGYTAMLSSDFAGLAQLGLFAITGLLSALLTTRYLLPCLLPPGWQVRHDFAAGAVVLDRLTQPATRWRRVALTLTVLLAILLILKNPLFSVLSRQNAIIWDDDLAALSPVPAAALSLDRELRQALRAPDSSKMLVIKGPDAETVLQRSEALEATLKQFIASGWLEGFDMAAFYLPSVARQTYRQAQLPARDQLQDRLQQAINGVSSRRNTENGVSSRRNTENGVSSRRNTENGVSSGQNTETRLPFKPDLFAPFLQAVEKSRQLSPLTPASIAGSALHSRVQSLLFATEAESHWLALLPLSGVRNAQELRDFFAKHPHAEYLDLRQESSRLIAGFRDAALLRLGIGVVLIFAALILVLRSAKRALTIMLPILAALCLTVGVLLLSGVRLSLFHLVTLLLVLGIGLDYCLFFSRSDADPAVRRRIFCGILLCSGSTLIVFAMLAFSQLPVLRAIGLTAAIGVCTSFIMALLLTPQHKNMMNDVSPQKNADDG